MLEQLMFSDLESLSGLNVVPRLIGNSGKRVGDRSAEIARSRSVIKSENVSTVHVYLELKPTIIRARPTPSNLPC